MAKSTRGRRAVAQQLGLVDHPVPAAKSGKREIKPPRQQLPTDRIILWAMIKRVFKWIVRLVAAFFIVSILLVIIYRFIDPPITPLMLIRPLEGATSGNVVGVTKEWIDIDDVNPVLLRSLIAAEDGRFFIHGGVDMKALERAQAYNERMKGKKLRGASTITMQCARNVFLWQGRNYIRKGLEIYFTYLMEFVWGKKRILEVYINVIEWGDGIYGVEAASQKYFGISARDLNARQAALLASVLPNPRRWSPAAPTGYITKRASGIQGRARGVSLAPINTTNKGETTEPKRKKKP